MSNIKTTNRQKQEKRKNMRTRAPKTKKKFENDYTPTVQKVSIITKFAAVFIAILVIINVHVIARGGGYTYEKVVPVMGISISSIESNLMVPDVPEKACVMAKSATSYEVGDVVIHLDGEKNLVRKVVSISENQATYELQGLSEDKSVKIPAEDIYGKVFASPAGLYSFNMKYHSAVGAAVLVILSFLLLITPDIMMYKTRKQKLAEYRENQAKKKARRERFEKIQNGETVEESAIERRQREKEEKLDKEREEIANEMLKIQKQMKKEEEELKASEARKKKGGKK